MAEVVYPFYTHISREAQRLLENDLVQEALEKATEWHAGQVRKYTGGPYIDHPWTVARDVAEAMTEMGVSRGYAQVNVMAAILHDTIEDTHAKFEHINELFGWNVATKVFELTDQIPHSAGNREIRKKLRAYSLSRAGFGTKVIKLFDLYNNAGSILKHDKDFGRVYLKEAEMTIKLMACPANLPFMQLPEKILKEIQNQS